MTTMPCCAIFVYGCKYECHVSWASCFFSIPFFLLYNSVVGKLRRRVSRQKTALWHSSDTLWSDRVNQDCCNNRRASLRKPSGRGLGATWRRWAASTEGCFCLVTRAWSSGVSLCSGGSSLPSPGAVILMRRGDICDLVVAVYSPLPSLPDPCLTTFSLFMRWEENSWGFEVPLLKSGMRRITLICYIYLPKCDSYLVTLSPCHFLLHFHVQAREAKAQFRTELALWKNKQKKNQRHWFKQTRHARFGENELERRVIVLIRKH